MKEQVEQQLAAAIDKLKDRELIPGDVNVPVSVSRTRDASHGDFASNLAMLLAKPARRAPVELAREIVDALPASELIRQVDIAGPGFINFHLADTAQTSVIPVVLKQAETFGCSQAGGGQRIQVEFVSANPTGPLHVGHGRGAALGATLANLLQAVGYQVEREYYVNDAGRQMDILAVSVWLRYLEICGKQIPFPANGYKGEYIKEISQRLFEDQSETLTCDESALLADLVADEPAGGDKEAHIDALIDRSQALLGEEGYQRVFDLALNAILEDIKADLGDFGVTYDHWFSENSIASDVSSVIRRLETGGHIYKKDGVSWFRSTDFGDDKDRPVMRANGKTTYFASDIAYIDNKLQRGFDQVLYVFGADHHGYTARMLAACEALGYERKRLQFLLIQFAILYRGGEQVQMSTRSGSFVTLRELRDEVGNDAARYFYVMRKYSQGVDFDLDLAKSQSNENPVYYVQYAHARICSVLRQLEQRQMTLDKTQGLAGLHRLDLDVEQELAMKLADYPDMLVRAARAREPHQLTIYVRELANALHSYYNAHKVLVDDAELRNARLCLLLAVRQVIANALLIIGVSAPEVM